MRFKIWFETYADSERKGGYGVLVESFECVTAKSWAQAVSYAYSQYEDALVRVERIPDEKYLTVKQLLEPDDE